jgi:hypothetical protein
MGFCVSDMEVRIYPRNMSMVGAQWRVAGGGDRCRTLDELLTGLLNFTKLLNNSTPRSS